MNYSEILFLITFDKKNSVYKTKSSSKVQLSMSKHDEEMYEKINSRKDINLQ